MKRGIKQICKNCKLFDERNGECSVIILHEGEKMRIPVDPEDNCFFEQQYFDPTTKAVEEFADEIKQVKIWVENEKGEKVAGDGVVKMEYPEGFFGTPIEENYPDDSEEFKEFMKEFFQED